MCPGVRVPMWDAKGRTGSANYVREKGWKEEKTEIKRKKPGNPGFPVVGMVGAGQASCPRHGLNRMQAVMDASDGAEKYPSLSTETPGGPVNPGLKRLR